MRLQAWRLDLGLHANTIFSAYGAEKYGGRWNSKGHKVVYCSLDPATCILEVAVHKGFAALDTSKHILTQLEFDEKIKPYRLKISDVPNPHWLVPGTPSRGQQTFGDTLLEQHAIVLVPSVVSKHSWNLLFDPERLDGKVRVAFTDVFALDGRLSADPGTA